VAKKESENILNFFHGSDINETAKERILIYGRAGVGKTRFGLSIPEHWGRIAYYAADKNSWLLSSISQKKRDRIEVVRPEGPDPTSQFMQFCMMDLDELGPDIGVIVVDTYTKVAMDGVSYTANSLSVDREKHYIIGELGKGGIAIPNRGDYQGIDGLSKSYLDTLFDSHPDKHIIFIMHEESKMVGGANGTMIGGPQHPGWTMIDYLPAQFSTIVRLIRDEVLVPGADDVTPVVVAITEYDGKFPAKLRTCDEEAPNPLARRELARNPSSWWEDYEAYMTDLSTPVVKKKKPKKTA
jgi:hypothetical protein